jgi:predicted dehydrogenase
MTDNDTRSDESISVGFTGVGSRGERLLETCAKMNDVEIPAVCDVQEHRLDAVEETLSDAGRPAPQRYHDHESMVSEVDLDGVIIVASWRHHVPMAIQAMEADVWPGLDVGPANTVEECWELVKTAEDTGNCCMLLENGCYGRSRLAVLKMVREGLFGELVHCECGYCHDLRGRLNAISGTSREETALEESGDRYFRGIQHEKRNGDLYPTHGVGPMAKCLDINHGNRFVSLTSTASKSRGLDDWAERNLPADHPSRNVDWNHGDVVTTVIECANGETLTVTHDVSLPRPDNSKRLVVRGTRGIWHDERDAIYVDDRSPNHEWEDFGAYRDEFEHPLWETYRDEGVQSGHGGSDYLVLRSFVESIAQNVRPPIDVYDTAAWMAISPLSERSTARGNRAVSFPDFTNGAWMDDEPIFGLTGDVDENRLDFEMEL